MLLKEILFPRFCIGCNKLGRYVCRNCLSELILLNNQSCIYCFNSSYLGLTHDQCLRQNGIDGALALFKYNNLLKKIIKTIKYRLASDILEELISIAEKEVPIQLSFFLKKNPVPLFQPIPLHKKRQKQRGFNQAQAIIKRLKKHISITGCDFLIRVKNTPPQAQIADRKERLRNTKGAFDVSPEKRHLVAGKTFFLVDDVVTSGSTVKEAARTLKLYGATKVYVVSLAKG